MDKPHILNYVTDTGETGVANVIDIFSLNDYPNKEYVVYTNGDSNPEDVNSQLFISELVENEDTFYFRTIEDEKEFLVAQQAIYELSEGDE